MVSSPKSLLSWDDDESGSKGTDFEEKIYGILLDAMERSDAAAKAIARIQSVLYEQQVESEEQPTLDPEALAEKDGITTTVRKAESNNMGEFDQNGFYNMFMGVNTIKLVKSVLTLMRLEELEGEVMSTMIDGVFGKHPSSSSSTPKEMVAGSEMELLVQQLRKTAERKQKQKNRK